MLHIERVIDCKIWNEKLLQTDASFFQYPYFIESYKEMPFSSTKYFLIKKNEEDLAFVSVIEVGFAFFKIGLIVRGPVLLGKENSKNDVIEGLKLIAHQNRYIFIRVNPNIGTFEDALKEDNSFEQHDYFPLYKGSQRFDFNIHKVDTEEEILKGYQAQLRREVRYGQEYGYDLRVSNSLEDLERSYEIFKKVSDRKGFSYRPFKSFKLLLENGRDQNLANLYMAYKDGKLVNALVIIKDRDSYNYMSGGLVMGEIPSKYSPSPLLHHKAILDCFAENKKRYNISASQVGSNIYKFKMKFSPVPEEYPTYYTYVSNKRLFSLYNKVDVNKVKKKIRKLYGNKK
jgi:lipid II:glycine glycyltransferase (peptidoglycan interpeptide bridge formation enzyme)